MLPFLVWPAVLVQQIDFFLDGDFLSHQKVKISIRIGPKSNATALAFGKTITHFRLFRNIRNLLQHGTGHHAAPLRLIEQNG
jgi:hypothetical protein